MEQSQYCEQFTTVSICTYSQVPNKRGCPNKQGGRKKITDYGSRTGKELYVNKQFT